MTLMLREIGGARRTRGIESASSTSSAFAEKTMGVLSDHDPGETQEWLDSLKAVVHYAGAERGAYLLGKLREEARRIGAMPPFLATTPYMNTIAPEKEEKSTGNREIEHRNPLCDPLERGGDHPAREQGLLGARRPHCELPVLGAALRHRLWSLLARAERRAWWGFVVRAGARLAGDLRAGVRRGRLSEQQLLNYRQEADGKGISSYPHPWLMPEFWQFPTVSMGLGPLMAIYQARFLKYLEGRGLAANGQSQGVGVSR
jgi:pyruvate dehydrogenase E1 component